eukprot:1597021-Prymnesium_polylepis.1
MPDGAAASRHLSGDSFWRRPELRVASPSMRARPRDDRVGTGSFSHSETTPSRIFRPFVAKGFFAFLGLIHGSILHRLFINRPVYKHGGHCGHINFRKRESLEGRRFSFTA